LLVGCVAFAAALVFATRTDAVASAFIAIGLAGGLAAAPILSLPVRVLEPAARAVGMGIFFTLFYLHVVVGPWIGGALATMAGTSRVTFDLGAAMLVLCCAALWVFRRISATSR
ncbi:MAG TPA: MFS transporter, partial [Hyphomicrobiaceae bacterium]|nr:MFS transporter [Hyphomicrobiaceae bacterium]